MSVGKTMVEGVQKPPLTRVALGRPLSLFGLALFYTLLNAPKPLLIDDGAYYYYARQIAADPLRPYAFEMFWYQFPLPAMQVLAPPGLTYWWSIAYALFGEQPFVWKLWLLPYSVLFVFALHTLFRRFAHGLEWPLLLLTLFSPTFLPSLNLMLDVPALALMLGAITVFMRACARESLALTLVAGLLAGVGMETKYTAFMAPCVILLYAVLFRRLVFGVLAVTLAGAVFAGWEYFIFAYHGKSHFMVSISDRHSGWDVIGLTKMLVTYTGGLCPPITLLGLAALGVRWWKAGLVAGALLLGYSFVALFSGGFYLVPGSSTPRILAKAAVNVEFECFVFGLFGLLWFGIMAAVFWKLFARAIRQFCFGEPEPAESPDDDPAFVDEPLSVGMTYPWWLSPFLRLDLFLLFWFLGEVVAFYFLTPFPATRRVMGVMLVATLIAGRVASRTCRSRARLRVLYGATAISIGFGCLFASVDMLDAFASKDLAERAATYIKEREPDAQVWYVGHWGFQYYAERAGMVPVVPGGWPGVTPTHLKAGDWLVVPEPRLNQQSIHVETDRTDAITDIVISDGVPLRTVQCFYGGRIPLEHHDGHRARLTIYKVTEAFVPMTERE